MFFLGSCLPDQISFINLLHLDIMSHFNLSDMIVLISLVAIIDNIWKQNTKILILPSNNPKQYK